jgi:hypothetical protein
MVFMNAAGGAASAAAASGVRRYVPPYPRNSAIAHIVLFLFTAGVGNILYALYIAGQQSKWRQTYG